MNIDFSLFFLALGLAFVLEACLWLLFPAGMRDAVRHLAEMSDAQLQRYGFAVIAIGLLLCALGNYLKG